ncbi:hypothetical protein CNR22_02920 [Sphingobacteriaceae bacterium]|nr:hypothetical protein CNR22_02920 [Sphingobacteriaceae bacterium]
MSIIASVKRPGNTHALNPLSARSGFLAWVYFISAAFIVLILSPLFQKGCFIDGMLYKTVAYNYAEGLGSFWTMKFTNSSMVQFCEQPPFYFYLLGNFYKAFGDHYLVDRIFTLLLFLIFVFILNHIVKSLFRKPQLYFVLSIFILLSIPVFCWSYVNQIIEPLQCVLVALELWFFIRFIHSRNRMFVVAFACVLFLLFLGKGFQSCFVIVLPITYALISKFEKRYYYFVVFSGILFLTLLFSCVWLYSPAKTWLECYYQARLVLTLNNVGNTTDNHFEIIGRFFSELIGCLIILALLFSYLAAKKHYAFRFIFKNFLANKLAVALLITSFAGSLPYAISLVQRGFYLIPSFVCFVLALVYGFKRYWLFFFLFLAEITKLKITRLVFGLLALGSIVYFCMAASTYKRNEDLLKDIDLILPYLKKGETVSIEAERWNDFSLHAYLYMARQVSLSASKERTFYSIRSKEIPLLAGDSLKKINLDTREIELYVRMAGR